MMMFHRTRTALTAALLLSSVLSPAMAQDNPPAADDAPANQPGGVAPGISSPQPDHEGEAAGSSSEPQDQTNAAPGTTTIQTKGGATVETAAPAGDGTGQDAATQASARPAKTGPDAWMQSPQSWATFNGDLMAQKYSPADTDHAGQRPEP